MLVGERGDNRCRGVMRERNIISSVMGPWGVGGLERRK